MSSTASVSYAPRRFASGTFPVSKDYSLRQMLYNYAHPKGTDDQVVPSFPFGDVPIYADTVDMETLAFHDIWGCVLTPENVAARIGTDDLRYHAWVASKRVVESGLFDLKDKKGLMRAGMDQFMVELGLVLLDLFPGPLVLFIDPRFQDDSEQMVSRARVLVAKFDAAHVRRWRIIVTLPATEDGICAAWELTHRYNIQTHLSLVSCLAHASACIEAGAKMVSMSVGPIMEWFEQQYDVQPKHISQDHPGIEAIQSCATHIRHHGINTTLLTTEVRNWSELKQLGGIGATTLRKDQLDEIPMQRMTTWTPRPDDKSPATLCAPKADYPSHYLDSDKSFLASLPAQTRSLVLAVLYVRLGEMISHMETIEKAVWHEIKRRIRLETTPLEYLYRRPSAPTETRSLHRSTSGRSTASTRSKSRSRSASRQVDAPEQKTAVPDAMVEDVDYF